MIDWDAQPLGDVPDATLARRLGCSRTAVHQARRRRGVPAVPSRCERIDWDTVDLGSKTDKELASELRVAPTTVGNARRARCIPVFRPVAGVLTRQRLVDLYGKRELSTYTIGDLLGVSQGAVALALRRHGIPRRTIATAMCTASSRDKSRTAALRRAKAEKG